MISVLNVDTNAPLHVSIPMILGAMANNMIQQCRVVPANLQYIMLYVQDTLDRHPLFSPDAAYEGVAKTYREDLEKIITQAFDLPEFHDLNLSQTACIRQALNDLQREEAITVFTRRVQ